MGAVKKQSQVLPQAFADVHAMYAKRLNKTKRALTKLESQRYKLAILEVELAELVQRYVAEHAQADGSVGAKKDKLERAYVIVNPKSKCLADGTIRLETVVDELRAVGILAEIGLKASGKVARKLARAAVKRGDPLLIVAAGDGTIEDVAPELIGSHTALGILPLGTMNNLARALGVPLDLPSACQLLAMRTIRQLDIGHIITSEPSHKAYFLESAGVGLSALAAPMGQDFEKGRWSSLFGNLGKFFVFEGAHITITIDNDHVLHTDTALLLITNSPLFGNHMLAAPNAKLDDGLLDLAVYGGMSKIDLQSYFLNISNGNRVDEPRVHFHQARKIRVTADGALEANADMDVFAEQQTWEFEVIPQALTVVVGNGIALTLPVIAAPTPPPLSGPQLPPESNPG